MAVEKEYVDNQVDLKQADSVLSNGAKFWKSHVDALISPYNPYDAEEPLASWESLVKLIVADREVGRAAIQYLSPGGEGYTSSNYDAVNSARDQLMRAMIEELWSQVDDLKSRKVSESPPPPQNLARKIDTLDRTTK